MSDDPLMITVRRKSGVILDATIDDEARKPLSLAADDDFMQRSLTGLAVLCGCVEAILKEEFEKKVSATSPGSMRRATTTRPEAPTCEGGCE